MNTIMDLVDYGIDPQSASEEVLEDCRFRISDLADDIYRSIHQVEDEYGKEPAHYPDGLYDAITALQSAVWDLKEAEDKIARAL